MKNKNAHIATLFKSIGHPIRVSIIRIIYENETLSVGEIQNYLKIHQPVISLHLGILRKHNIISAVKKGKNNFYFIKNKSISQVVEIIYHDTNLK